VVRSRIPDWRDAALPEQLENSVRAIFFTVSFGKPTISLG
jgi:hypothetical protein